MFSPPNTYESYQVSQKRWLKTSHYLHVVIKVRPINSLKKLFFHHCFCDLLPLMLQPCTASKGSIKSVSLKPIQPTYAAFTVNVISAAWTLRINSNWALVLNFWNRDWCWPCSWAHKRERTVPFFHQLFPAQNTETNFKTKQRVTDKAWISQISEEKQKDTKDSKNRDISMYMNGWVLLMDYMSPLKWSTCGWFSRFLESAHIALQPWQLTGTMEGFCVNPLTVF